MYGKDGMLKFSHKYRTWNSEKVTIFLNLSNLVLLKFQVLADYSLNVSDISEFMETFHLIAMKFFF